MPEGNNQRKQQTILKITIEENLCVNERTQKALSIPDKIIIKNSANQIWQVVEFQI